MIVEPLCNLTLAPPLCCQPPLDEMLGLGDDDDALVPCPACGSRVTMPTMLAPGERQCWERECAAIFTVNGPDDE